MLSPIQRPTKSGEGLKQINAPRRRRKETVNERVEHILRGALREAEEEELQEREGTPETRGRVLQRSHQLAALYSTSTDNKFLRTRAKRRAEIERNLEIRNKRDSEALNIHPKLRPGSDCASVIGEGDEDDESDDGQSSSGRLVLASPIKGSVSWNDTSSLASMTTSPVKPKPWYNCSPNASLKQQLPPGITLDAKLRRYGARGTAKLMHGSRSVEMLEPLSPSHPIVPIDEYVQGLDGSPSLWPPEAFYPSGSRLAVMMTRCPSSPIAISVEVDNRTVDPCQQHVDVQQALQHKSSRKLQAAHKREDQVAKEQRLQNQQDMVEWQGRTLHFQPTSELAAHRQQQQDDPQLRHRRTSNSAIVQTPGYSPEKQSATESRDLRKNRFSLRWWSFAKILDAMRRTPCRRPVLKDMEKLFTLARELCALNVRGSCMLSRSQFVLLVTREFPLCDVKYVNRLFSSYDWELRDSVDTRVVLGTIRAMRVQQGEPVEIICASLRDFDDSTGGGADDNKTLVSDGVHLKRALSLCCASDEDEQDMANRADGMWSKLLSWQRQILSRRLSGGMGYNIWKAKGTSTSSALSTVGGSDDEVVKETNEDVDEEDGKEELSELTKLVDESRVPLRRVRVALKREKTTLQRFTDQLLQRRHECMVNANANPPRKL